MNKYDDEFEYVDTDNLWKYLLLPAMLICLPVILYSCT